MQAKLFYASIYFFFLYHYVKNKIISYFSGENAKLSDEFKSSDDTDYDKFLFYSILNFFHRRNRKAFLYSEPYLRKSFSNSLSFLLLTFQKTVRKRKKKILHIFSIHFEKGIFIFHVGNGDFVKR